MITKVYGPPGTGKTRWLLDKFEEKLKKDQVPPNRIGFLTFTRAARLEALGRTGMTEGELPYLRTIHAMCYRQLGVTQGQMVRRDDLREFAKILGIRLQGVQHADPWEEAHSYMISNTPTRDDKLLQINHLGRHRLVALKDGLRDADLDIDYKYAKWFTEAYRNWKTQEALMDYTDILQEYLKYGSPLEIDTLFVDEAQDLSRLQWQVVHKLGYRAQHIYMAGDDDQTIFAWAGASAEAFNSEPAEELVFLERSNRVPEAVVKVARDIIARVNNRAEKPWLPKEGSAGETRSIPFISEDDLNGPKTFILFRNHHRGQLLRDELINIGVPFTGEHSPLSHKWTNALVKGWADLHSNHKEINSYTVRVILECAREDVLNQGLGSILRKEGTRTFKYGDIFNQELKPTQFFNVFPNIPEREFLIRAVTQYGFAKLVEPTVHLMSIHQSKGREAHTVILDTEMARKTFDSWFASPDDEHRVWYVGVTRAEERLLTLLPEGTMSYPL